jgi:hypothetical protein
VAVCLHRILLKFWLSNKLILRPSGLLHKAAYVKAAKALLDSTKLRELGDKRSKQ